MRTQGKYDKFIFRFDNNWQHYEFTQAENIHLHNINFCVLDNGICLHMNETKKLNYFHTQRRWKL